ncbi:MAG TPA: DUF5694 domain-containing protein [Thermoanaerobaculia bacterium]
MLVQVLLVSTVFAQSSPTEGGTVASRGEVLVLGVYHMNNPGRDVFNLQVDDVLAPKRQAEMARVIEVLKSFKPTKIAVEGDTGDRRITKAYAEYVAGNHELTRNEIEQLGFRLAKELGHQQIYPVDAGGEFPYPRLQKYVKATDRSKEFEALVDEIGAMVKAENAYLASHTILETLLYMNADAKAAEDVGFYLRQAEFGEHYDWAGADLVSDWFRRNLRIYTNVAQLSESRSERILVIYGAGHLGWLQFAFANNPRFRLRKLAEFVR